MNKFNTKDEVTLVDINECNAKLNATVNAVSASKLASAKTIAISGGTIICGGTTALTSFTVKSATSTFSGSVTCESMTVKSALNIHGDSIWIE